jgi:hypothetical protein
MTSTQPAVAPSAVAELLKEHGGDAVVALQALLERIQTREVAVPEKSTVATRKEAYRKMWADYDVDKLIEVKDLVEGLIDRISSTDLEGDGVISSDLAKQLMQEHLDTRAVTEAFDARKELRKARVFAAIDAVLEARGIEDPQNHNGEVEVPELGLKFTREGAGMTEGGLDEGKLRVVLGEEMWKVVCDTEIIPATVEYKLNTTRLLDLANADPAILTKIGECVKPGVPKTPRLNTRKLS